MARKKAVPDVETPQDGKERKKLHEVASKWLKAISKRRKQENAWRTQADKVLKRYRDERETDTNAAKFAILWANTEVMKPAIFARMPVPDVRRRFLTKDPVARTAAMIMERALSFTMDTQDFKDTLDRALEDYLLPGRAQAVVTYKPYIGEQRKAVEPLPPGEGEEEAEPTYPEGTQQDDQGAYQMTEEKVWEEVRIRYQPWRYYVFGQAVQRCQVPWEAYGECLTQDDIEERFPGFKKAKELPYSADYDDPDKDDKDEVEKKCLVWSVWDKNSRMLITVAEGFQESPVDLIPDPLGLENFFPAPEPMYSLRTNGTDKPKPEFLMYQDQADELDILCARQRALASALKYRGVYDKQLDEVAKISDLVKAPDNTFIGVANYSQLAEKGGLEALLDTLPLEEIQAALGWITERIELLKQEIYEIYGISDIVRGASKASETLGAQQLKAQYAGMRISTRQERFQRFVRDLLRLCGEVIVEHFDPQTLQIMSGVQVMPDQAYQLAKQAQALDSGAVSQTDFLSACALLKSDKLRGFKIDIETDSTVPVDKNAEQQNRVQFMQAIGQYLAGVIPAVESGAIPAKVAREGLLFVVRGFKVGSELEETLEEIGSNEDEQAQLQQLKKAQAQMGEQMQQLQQENGQLKSDAATKAQEAQVKAAIDQHKAASDIQIDQYKAQSDARIKEQAALHDEQIKSLAASHDAQIKEHAHRADMAQQEAKQQQEAVQETPQQVESPETNGRLDALLTGQQSQTEALTAIAQSQDAQTKALMAMIQQMAKPKNRVGRAMLPSGPVELQMTEQ